MEVSFMLRMLLQMLSTCHSIGAFNQFKSPMPVRDRIVTHLVKKLLFLAYPSRDTLAASAIIPPTIPTQNKTRIPQVPDVHSLSGATIMGGWCDKQPLQHTAKTAGFWIWRANSTYLLKNGIVGSTDSNVPWKDAWIK